MHSFPGHRFTPPLLIRGGRVIPPPSSYQPPYIRFQPVVLAYPAALYLEIGKLAMNVIMALDPSRTSHAPPTFAFAPMSLAVLR